MTTTKRTAIITGASSGIGAAIATRLAADGFNVIVNYRSGEDAARSLAKQISDSGGTALAVQGDVSKFADAQGIFDQTEAAFGAVDVLVNNAGVMKLARLAETDEATFDMLVAVNLKGTFNMLREAATRVRKGGSIINLSTSVVGMKLETYSIYTATKAAVESLTATLSKELRGKNITVNAVAPGPTSTELFLNGKSDELIQQLAKMPPLERLGEPRDIASVVSFLAGPDGAWINGQVLRANGGIV